MGIGPAGRGSRLALSPGRSPGAVPRPSGRGVARAVLAVALVVPAILGRAPAAAEPVPLHRVPRAVNDAVAARFPGARVLGVEKDPEGGATVYEVAIRQGGRRVDVIVTPQGGVLWIKRELAPGDLPRAVAEALRDRHPGAVLRVAEEVTAVASGRETLAGYEVVLVTPRRALVELQVSPEGRVLTGAWR